MNKEELYELALSDIHKYNLLNEIFAIRDLRGTQIDYCIKVNGFISLDVLNQYVNKIDENTNLKQELNEIREICYGSDMSKVEYDKVLQIIDKVLGDDKN